MAKISNSQNLRSWRADGVSPNSDTEFLPSTSRHGQASGRMGPMAYGHQRSSKGAPTKNSSCRYIVEIPCAPITNQTVSNCFARYFSAYEKAKDGTKPHCIGAAISDEIAGVYHPVNDFKQCNETGVIDPAWFKDDDGKQYVVYKTDRPKVFLEIREVSNRGPKEGVQWTGNAQPLLKMHSQGHSDGYNLEAPYIFKNSGIYFLAYSTHFYGDGSYDVQYATAKNVKGPYTRAKEPLLKTTDAFGCKLIGPGSPSFQKSCDDEKTVKIIFHGLKDPIKPMRRQLYTATVHVNGTKLYIKK